MSYCHNASSVRPSSGVNFHFLTSPPKPLNRFWRNLTESKPSTSSTKFVFYCRSVIQVGRPGLWLAETFFDFFSATAEWILTKLDRKQVLNALYQVCVFRADRKSKMAALASDWLKHFSASSPQPLNGFSQNLTGSKSSTPSIKFVFFVPIGNPRLPPWPLIDWNIFRLLLHNRWMDFHKTWQEASLQHPLSSLCFSCRSEIQDCHPGLWLAEIFFYFSYQTTEQILTKLDRTQVLNALY